MSAKDKKPAVPDAEISPAKAAAWEAIKSAHEALAEKWRVDERLQDARDELIDLVYRGVIGPKEAEARAIEMGGGAFEKEPDESSVDLAKIPHWTIAMTVSWISTREERAVMRYMDSWREKTSLWIGPRTAFVPKDGNPGAQIYRNSYLLEQADPPRVLEESFQNRWLRTSGRTAVMSREAAWGELRTVLQTGALAATGRSEFGQRVSVAAHLWQDMEFYLYGNRETLRPRGSSAYWVDVTVDRTEVLRLWKLPKAEKGSLGATRKPREAEIRARLLELKQKNNGRLTQRQALAHFSAVKGVTTIVKKITSEINGNPGPGRPRNA